MPKRQREEEERNPLAFQELVLPVQHKQISYDILQSLNVPAAIILLIFDYTWTNITAKRCRIESNHLQVNTYNRYRLNADVFGRNLFFAHYHITYSKGFDFHEEHQDVFTRVFIAYDQVERVDVASVLWSRDDIFEIEIDRCFTVVRLVGNKFEPLFRKQGRRPSWSIISNNYCLYYDRITNAWQSQVLDTRADEKIGADEKIITDTKIPFHWRYLTPMLDSSFVTSNDEVLIVDSDSTSLRRRPLKLGVFTRHKQWVYRVNSTAYRWFTFLPDIHQFVIASRDETALIDVARMIKSQIFSDTCAVDISSHYGFLLAVALLMPNIVVIKYINTENLTYETQQVEINNTSFFHPRVRLRCFTSFFIVQILVSEEKSGQVHLCGNLHYDANYVETRRLISYS